MWIVPVTACCGSYDAQKKFLLKDKMDKINIKEFSDSQSADGEKNQIIWIKLNIDQTGFYRVKYDDELAAGLVNAIKAKKLSLMDKIGKDKKKLVLLYTFSRFFDKVTHSSCRYRGRFICALCCLQANTDVIVATAECL